MNDGVNLLILSCGTRNKIIQYFKLALTGKGMVIATDCSPLAPALYDADRYYIVSKINSQAYLETVISLCKENHIHAVLSLIDPELVLLAKHRDEFLAIGTVPIVSNETTIALCFNKYAMHQFLEEHQFKTIKTYLRKEAFYADIASGKMQYPIFVKPIQGSASIHNFKVSSKEELELLYDRFDHMMIQEFIEGSEYGADCYVDMITNEPVAIFTKEKLKMRAGETDKAVSMKDEKLFALILRLLRIVGFRGVVDIDVFKVNGEYIISEVNPRFGGGYLHAYECGINIPQMIVENIVGKANENVIGQYQEGVYMMKYNEVKILR